MVHNLELERADKALREASIRCDTIKVHLSHLEREIAEMIAVETTIEQNISILKNSSVIALVSEYKKAREDLTKAKNRLVFLRIDRNNHYHALTKAEKILHECKEKLVQLMTIPIGKVIQGNFGKKWTK